mgnify:CR=1 FL=1|tara:strand:+ start:45 stop:770 length:726 start_codon:yes stop_codon:yes gene_type:complete
MAVSVNNVYQKVLAIANKEQRGYITPQEFNLFANQAQMDIFEQYFYDINQFNRVPGNSTEYSDMLNLLEEKISIFDQFKVAMSAVSGNQLTLPTDVYRLGTVFYGGAGYDVEVEKVNKKDLEYMSRTALYAPTDSRPVYTKKSETLLKLFPASPSTSYTTGNVTCNYIKKPATVKWAYTVVVGKALYNSSATDLQDFELHASEENNLIIKILALAGVSIKDPSVYQIAAAEDNKNIQQEKQ